nr:DUF4870 domain-containing protein [Friedmanniella luteola]
MSQVPAEPSAPPPHTPPPGQPDPRAAPGGRVGGAPPSGPAAAWGPQAPGGPGYPPSAGRPPVGAPLSPSDESRWALLAHLSIPFLGFAGPLVVHLVFQDRSRWLGESALEGLNFSILYTLVMSASALLTVLLIGFALLPVAFIASLVLAVLAAVAASRHELYRYPVNGRLVR